MDTLCLAGTGDGLKCWLGSWDQSNSFNKRSPHYVAVTNEVLYTQNTSPSPHPPSTWKRVENVEWMFRSMSLFDIVYVGGWSRTKNFELSTVAHQWTQPRTRQEAAANLSVPVLCGVGVFYIYDHDDSLTVVMGGCFKCTVHVPSSALLYGLDSRVPVVNL